MAFVVAVVALVPTKSRDEEVWWVEVEEELVILAAAIVAKVEELLVTVRVV